MSKMLSKILDLLSKIGGFVPYLGVVFKFLPLIKELIVFLKEEWSDYDNEDFIEELKQVKREFQSEDFQRKEMALAKFNEIVHDRFMARKL